MKRDLTIDTLKGFLVLLVIFGHLIGSLKVIGGEPIWNLIYTFHMPLFVLVSGYFSRRDRLKCSTIIRPLLVFQLINVIALSILGHKFTYTYLLIPHWTLWYLLSLVSWRFILKYIPKGLLNRPYVSLGITIIAALIIGVVFPYGRILSIQRTITFLPYFLMGYYFRTNSIKQKLWSNTISKCLLIVICFVVILGCYPSNASILLRGADPYSIQDLPAKMFLLLCTLVCVYSLWNLKCEVLCLAKIGKDSLFYYLYHGLIIQFFIVPVVGRFNLPTGLLGVALYFLLLLFITYLMGGIPIFRWLVNPVFKHK